MGWLEGGAEERNAGVVGVVDDVRKADLDTAKGFDDVEKADLKAAGGAAGAEVCAVVDESDLDSVEVVTQVEEADLDTAGCRGNGDGGELEAVEGSGGVDKAEGDAVEGLRMGKKGIQPDAGERFGDGDNAHVEPTDSIVDGTGKVEAQSDDGGVGGDELEAMEPGFCSFVWPADADLQRRERGGRCRAREERQEKREEDGEEFFHGSRVSGQRLKS